ncbi:ABC transporter ATP-binding protein [Aestuariicoccus sp. MJ-SS9]|uniref:ABC transporter ATP-binding protein n=1 Tax=Aestuariicoccus sp. MJ-SS9 TaxID=3079855 RepID=UPI0029099C9B|nr:ABC transporter ATP-binding protein [Aestuariicoccus sp. MJ-SS9]MDU8913487.1 ABC transporter ATP-binding protein [Aestuariicoccus sp. MJ-SS9]
MSLLDIENLSVCVSQEGVETPLVNGISYSVDRGETLALVGESGSGKSVSSLAVMGLLAKALRVTSGSIRFDGQDLLALDDEGMRKIRGRDISMVFQEPMTSLNPLRSIGAQIMESIEENLGLSRADARARAVSLLQEVGVADAERRLKQYPHHFSGGMRQRVMIAIALAADPKLIIADEPTTALDVTIQAQILDLMARICRDHGTALILITHNLGIVARYADRVNVMYGGRIVETGRARDIYAAPRHPYTEGLLQSVPRLDQDRSVPLKPIRGNPADPFTTIAGCRFHPRCPYAQAICRQTPPPFEGGVACHFPLETDQKEAV